MRIESQILEGFACLTIFSLLMSSSLSIWCFRYLLVTVLQKILSTFISPWNNLFEGDLRVLFSKYGLLTINNSALKQSIEIVRLRIDGVGTKEPTILQRGEKRILVFFFQNFDNFRNIMKIYLIQI